MLQAYMPEAGKIVYHEIEKPVPWDGQVLLKVSKVGICGSDLHVFEGKHPLVSFPLVQGHEFCGFISEVGKGVTKVIPGDLAVVQPAVGCGICEKCRAGVVAQCESMQFIGGALPGGGSEYFLADESQIIRLDPRMSTLDAAMIEPLAVAIHNIGKVPDIKGKNVMVMGAGTIGNLTAQVALLRGAGAVMVFDIDGKRIEAARQCGLQACCLTGNEGIGETIKMQTGKNKVFASFECVGKDDPLNNCIQYTERGGIIVVPGVYSRDPMVKMIHVQDFEQHIMGSLMYTWDDFYMSADFVEKNRVKLLPLQTHTVPFKNWMDGYDLLLKRDSGAIKVIVDLD